MRKAVRLTIGIIAAVGLVILFGLMLLIGLGVINEDFFLRDEIDAVQPSASSPVPKDDANVKDDGKVYYTISLVGDCTLAGNRFQSLSEGRADYPFANVAELFDGDDMTIANLECNFSDASLYSSSMFSFKAPTSNAKMLTSGGIDFVTTANNHTLDFGQTGLNDTFAALDAVGVSYGKDGESVLYTTDGGLKVGVYCGYYALRADGVEAAVAELKEMGAEYIICALHWGDEGSYRPTALQQSIAHAAVDAGADVVYGSHPHVLQPIEEYGDGIIMYSLGNFCFAGNSFPRDYDSVIVQITLCRDTDGTVSLDSYKLIPCAISSTTENNDYRPTLYSEGSDEYKRTVSKLDGSFKGANLIVDYTDTQQPSASPEPSDTETPIPSDTPDDPIPVPEPIEPPTVTE